MNQVYRDIESGKIREYNLFEHISMASYIKNKTDIDRAFEYRAGVLKLSAHRNIDVIYICGEPGSGKTSYAKNYCENRGYSYCLSGSSRDPLQDYRGQDALILDDLRPDVFSLPDLLKILDNHTASSANARYHDRWLEVKLIIITTIRPLEDFYAGLPDHSEPIQQIKRRCRTVINLSCRTMEVYQYNDTLGDYDHALSAKNPIKKDQYDELSAQRDQAILRDICADLGIEPPDKNGGENHE